MHHLTAQFLVALMGFFAIMNPIANTPVFLGLTAADSPATRTMVARRAILTAFLIVLIFSVLGKVIFDLFGIGLPAFRIAGGGLVVIIGYHMLYGQSSKIHAPREGSQEDLEAELSVAVTPLAMPILAGPGTIATAMNFTSGGGIGELLLTLLAFAVLCLATYLFFVYGERLVHYLGKNGIDIITRLMGLILMVIGVQMLLTGFHQVGVF